MQGSTYYIGAIGFASGILYRSFFDGGLAHVALLALLGCVFAGLWRLRHEATRTLFLASVFMIMAALGVWRLDAAATGESILMPYVGEERTFVGVVVREPDVRERSQHLYVFIEEADEEILVIADRFVSIAYGDVLTVEGALEEPTAFQTDLGRVFNYPSYLRAQGVSYMIRYPEVVVTGENTLSIRGVLYKGKQYFMEMVERVLPEPAAGLGEGVLLGVKRALGEDLEGIFRQAGIIHIVVLSGYNVMIVVEAVMRLLSFCCGVRIRTVLGVAAIVTFAVLVGLSATVVRASIMAILVLIARATGRSYAVLRALVFAGIAMLIFNPYLLAFDPGFQLSFLATLGLILVAPHIEERLRLVPTRFQIREFITATLATQLMVLPLLLYLMGEFSVVSVVVNVLVLPVVPFAMLLTFLVGVLGFIVPAVSIGVGYLAYLALQYIIVVASFAVMLPYAAVPVPVFPFWIVVVLYTSMAYVLFRFHQKEATGVPIMRTVDEERPFSDWVIETEVATETPRSEPLGSLRGEFPFR